ncbi:MAG: hypothetical protein M3Y13_02575 [Armatimonadota bacterium]|nr:hypothetical protein [Armatimonadota bacterium]
MKIKWKRGRCAIFKAWTQIKQIEEAKLSAADQYEDICPGKKYADSTEYVQAMREQAKESAWDWKSCAVGRGRLVSACADKEKAFFLSAKAENGRFVLQRRISNPTHSLSPAALVAAALRSRRRPVFRCRRDSENQSSRTQILR